MDDPRAKRREIERRYWEKYPDRRRELSIKANKKWRETNPEAFMENQRSKTQRWRDKHPVENLAKIRQQHQQRRLAILNGDHKAWAALLFSSAKGRAKRLGIPFNLTLDDIIVPSTCPVLHIPLQYGSRQLRDNSASLDRIDNAGGYVKGNVIVVSLRANKIKTDATPDEILQVGHFYKLLQEQRAQAKT